MMDQLIYLKTIYEALDAKKREIEEAQDLVAQQYIDTLDKIKENQAQQQMSDMPISVSEDNQSQEEDK